MCRNRFSFVSMSSLLAFAHAETKRIEKVTYASLLTRSPFTTGLSYACCTPVPAASKHHIGLGMCAWGEPHQQCSQQVRDQGARRGHCILLEVRMWTPAPTVQSAGQRPGRASRAPRRRWRRPSPRPACLRAPPPRPPHPHPCPPAKDAPRIAPGLQSLRGAPTTKISLPASDSSAAASSASVSPCQAQPATPKDCKPQVFHPKSARLAPIPVCLLRLHVPHPNTHGSACQNNSTGEAT